MADTTNEVSLQVTASVEDAEKKLDKLISKLDELQKKASSSAFNIGVGKATSGGNKVAQAMNSLPKDNGKLQNVAPNGVSRMADELQRSKEQSDSFNKSLSETPTNTFTDTFKGLSSGLSTFKKVTGMLKTVATTARNVEQALTAPARKLAELGKATLSTFGKKALNAVKSFGNATANAFKNLALAPVNKVKAFTDKLSAMFNAFKRIAFYRLLRTAIKEITQGFQEGIKAVYDYDKALGGSFSKTMDDLTSQLSLMKGSLGAMAMPLVELLAPAIYTITNAVIALANALNRLFSILSGKGTWTKATSAVKSYGEAAGGASKQQDKLTAGIDELNILSESAGGGGGADDVAWQFEQIKNDIGEISNIGRYLGEQLYGALDNLDWGTIKEKAGKIGTTIRDNIIGFLTTDNLGKKVGETIGEALNTAATFVANMFSKNNDGINIGMAFGSFVGDAIVEGLKTLDWATIKTAVNNVAENIGGYFSELFNTSGFIFFVGEGLYNGITTAIEYLETLVSTMPWSKMTEAFTTWLSKAFDAIGDKADLIGHFATAIDKITVQLSKDDKLAKSFANMINKVLESAPHFVTSIGDFISTVVDDIGKAIDNIKTSDIVNIANKIIGIAEKVASKVNSLLQSGKIEEILNGIDWATLRQTIVDVLEMKLELENLTAEVIDRASNKPQWMTSISKWWNKLRTNLLENQMLYGDPTGANTGTDNSFMGDWGTKYDVEGLESTATRIETAMSSIGTAVSNTSGIVYDVTTGQFRPAIDSISEASNLVYDAATGKFRPASDVIVDASNKVYDASTGTFRNAIEGMVKASGELESGVTNSFSNTKSSVEKSLEEIHDITELHSAASADAIRQHFEQAAIETTAKVGEIKQVASASWGDIRTSTKEEWINIQNTVINVWEHMKKEADTHFGEIKDTILQKWEGIETDANAKWGENGTITSAVRTSLSIMTEVFTATFIGENNIENMVTKAFNTMETSIATSTDHAFTTIDTFVGKTISRIDDLIRKLEELESAENSADIDTGGYVNSGPSVGHRASGGFMDYGQLYTVREGGIPEYVGSYGGRAAVANNDMIVDGISAGVYEAVASAMSGFGNNDRPLAVDVYLDGRKIESSVRQTRQRQGASVAVGGIYNSRI